MINTSFFFIKYKRNSAKPQQNGENLMIYRYSSARSAHSLHRPYENIVPVGIQPIAKRFSMAGCRLQFRWLNCNDISVTVQPAELLRSPVPLFLRQIQTAVNAALFQQFLMTALLGDFPVVQHDDAVHQPADADTM